MAERAGIADSISRAVGFLAAEQLSSGQFPMGVRAVSQPVAETAEDELSPFATTYVVHALAMSGDPRATACIDRAVDFLIREMEYGGLWRYWTKDAPLRRQIPLDTDDTACISFLLSEMRQMRVDNKPLLLANRNRGGLFYTWFLPRLTSGANGRFWKVMLTDMNRGRLFGFWRAGAKPGDVEAVVNANVIRYLGDTPECRPVLKYLLDVAESGKEAESDRYYRSAPAFYYALGRCREAGVTSVTDAAKHMRRRFAEAARSDGSLGDPLATAMSVSAMYRFCDETSLCEGAVDYLTSVQNEDGGWQACPIYFDGREVPQLEWGSRAATTGLCLEALCLSLSAGQTT